MEGKGVRDGGVQVVYVNAVFDGAVAELVGGAMDIAPFDAAAGESDGEAPVVVIAPHRGTPARQLDCRRTAALAAADHQRFLVEPQALPLAPKVPDIAI